ncbi:MAG TPA: CdaR family protein [Bryobacteraceae bacterium]|nr:CdaR family protein [Bryobacteraceae bacterium]
MTRTLKWILGLVFHNFWWKLLSLVIAVVLWALVASEPELATFATVRLEFKNLPENLEIGSSATETVSLELRGPSGELSSLGESKHPSVVLDLAGVQPGIRTFTVGDGNVKLPRGIRMVRATPSEVRFDFERRMVRSIPVEARFTGEGENGYVVAGYTVDPQMMTIVGPSNHVSLIRRAITDPLDVSGVVGSTVMRVNAYVEDAYVRFQTSPEVAVTVTMKKR